MRYDGGYRPGGRRTMGGRRGFPGYSADYEASRRVPRRYGGDYWWIGEHAMGRGPREMGYDRAYRRFSDETHPRFSPVGGMYPALGGRYATGGAPEPLREPHWFSEWTRWF